MASMPPPAVTMCPAGTIGKPPMPPPIGTRPLLIIVDLMPMLDVAYTRPHDGRFDPLRSLLHMPADTLRRAMWMSNMIQAVNVRWWPTIWIKDIVKLKFKATWDIELSDSEFHLRIINSERVPLPMPRENLQKSIEIVHPLWLHEMCNLREHLQQDQAIPAFLVRMICFPDPLDD